MLPANADKSPHPATIDEIEQRFVHEAPHSERRALIFSAFQLYAGLVWSYFPTARLWVNGGFVTHKEVAPHDIDVAMLAPSSDAGIFARDPDALALLTLQGVRSSEFDGVLRRLQPFGGLVDSFFVPEDNPLAVQTWKDRWSLAPLSDGSGFRDDLSKGFLEVAP
ncbi:DUF6932 family protein [Microterricola viridarii]|uniref:DUF6932 family protein n=1 Tax=Microterricola viridarii TaxID=412690 RepID=UPI0012EA50FC|nr:hypothetical protein [Microterricola viridarii]